MEMGKKKSLLGWMLLTQGTGLVAWALTRRGIADFSSVPKSALTPPGWVFFVVWTLLYFLMALGAARVARGESEGRARALTLFGLQLAVNFLWSIWFFGLAWYGVALVWLGMLWVLGLAMMRAFRTVDPLAAWLQWPYLAWGTFAGYLNAIVWLLNR